jgi:uncharacterized protein
MLIDFFFAIRKSGVKTSLKEFLLLLEALDKGLAEASVDEFYYLSRSALVKDERHFDKFDQAFAAYFEGKAGITSGVTANIPEAWLKKLAERFLTEDEKAEIEALGGWDKLMATLKQRLEEQQGRHQGGNKWIGTAGTSPFGAYGYNPEGIRIGQDKSRHRRAVKVWDQREYRDYDDQVELGVRNVKLALRKLRKFAREGAPDVLDVPGTIRATSDNAGWLDLKIVPELRNTVKVLLFLDVGGSMDDHIRTVDELFSAAKAEFKHLEHFYFHNCVYESVWRDNRRRHGEKMSVMDVLARYGRDYKLIFVGDASMSPYEIAQPGGSVEHWNEEAGAVWLSRLTQSFPRCVWINPVGEDHWKWTQSIAMIGHILEGRMFPMTLGGLDAAIARLR